MKHEWEGSTLGSRCARCDLKRGSAAMFGIHDCTPPAPTREETLQAERDAATAALADAVRKARDVALEEAIRVAEGFHIVVERIRALKSKP